MESIKSYATIFLIKLCILSIAAFYGILVAIKLIYSRVRYGSQFFQVKERTLPPKTLQDGAFRHSYIKLKDIKLHYAEAGDKSKPLMLFVHGYPEFWYTWRHQMKHFSKNYWVVAFDMRGYGDSEKPSGISNYKMELLVKDIVELVQGLGKTDCTLVAHDWGGVIAWTVAAIQPQVVKKLIILNAPHPGVFADKFKSNWKQFFKSWYIFFYQLPYLPELSSTIEDLAIFERLFQRPNGECNLSSSEIEAFKYTFSTKQSWTTPINFYRASMSATNLYKQEAQKLPKIKQPTLIVWGEGDIALESDFPELSYKYVENLRIHKIKEGNHFIQNDRPNEVNAAMENFLR